MDHERVRVVRPEEVLEPHVDPLTIGRYYLDVCFAKMFEADTSETAAAQAEANVARMDEEEVWRTVEMFSVTRGLNDVLKYLTNSSYIWSKEKWDIGALRLTGMNPAIDAVVRSETVQRRPFAFRDYLKDYFAKHPNDDPKGLGELRASNRPIRHTAIMLREHKGQPALLDGSHRLVEMLLQGETEVTAFVGRGDNSAPSRLGPGIFRTLRQAYENKPDVAILETVKTLVDQSTDGRQWVQIYWIDHVEGKTIKQKGSELLG